MPPSFKDLLDVRSHRCESVRIALKAVRDWLDYVRPDYLLDRFPSKLLVEPRLFKPPEREGYYWRDIPVPPNGPIVISGPKYGGKSQLLKWIARTFALEAIGSLSKGVSLDDILFPIYIDLAKVKSVGDGPLKRVALESIQTRMNDAGADPATINTVLQWLGQKLEHPESGQLVLLYDNFEKIGRTNWMTQPFAARRPCPRTYIATRMPAGPDDHEPPDAWPRYEIGSSSDGKMTGPFSQPDIDSFQDKWRGTTGTLKDKIAKNKAFARLMCYPYLLTLACAAVTDRSRWGFDSVYAAAKQMGVWEESDPGGHGWWPRAAAVLVTMVVAFGLVLRRDHGSGSGAIPSVRLPSSPHSSPLPSSFSSSDQDVGNNAVRDKDKFWIKDYYTSSGKTGDTGDVQIVKSEASTQFTYTTKGTGPHQWEYRTTGKSCGFAGVMYLDPPGNWGTKYGGLDLRGFKYVSFEARTLGEQVNIHFIVGGVHWVWDDKTTQQMPAPFPDKFYIDQSAQLVAKWKRIAIPLDTSSENLQRVIGVFGWTVSWQDNGIAALDNSAPNQAKTFTFEIRNLICTKSDAETEEPNQ